MTAPPPVHCCGASATPYSPAKGRGGRLIGALRPVHWEGSSMDLEKYTERSKGFIQSAQNLALRSGHQRLSPEHLLKVLLDDKEGLCANRINAAGGNAKAALASVETELNKLPRVEGSGAGQVY